MKKLIQYSFYVYMLVIVFHSTDLNPIWCWGWYRELMDNFITPRMWLAAFFTLPILASFVFWDKAVKEIHEGRRV